MSEQAAEPEAVGEVGPSPADPAAVALALGRASGGAGNPVDAEAAAFLHDQRALIADQRHHLKVQLMHLGLKYFADRLRVGLQIFLALGATAIGLFIAALVWQAATDRGLVIEPFSTPPDLAARGLTGEVIANQLEDRLSALQAQTDSGRAAASYSNDWGHEIKVEIPETGVSISELQRYLREWLGHETHIGGEVFHTADGLRLTVRAGGEAGDSASGAEADLDGLLQKGAEALFARTQPYRYGVYLMQQGRQAEAREVCGRLASDGPAAERPWGLLCLGLLEDDPPAAHALFQQGLALNPHLALLTFDDINTRQSLGHDEAVRQGLIRAIGLLHRSDHGSMTVRAMASSLPALQAQLDETTEDYQGALQHIGEIMAAPSYFGSREKAVSWRAQDLALDHDVLAARRAMPAGANDAALFRALLKWGGASLSHVALDKALDDWAGVLGELRALEGLAAEAEQQVASKGASYQIRTQLWPGEAEALAHLGRIGEAQALIARTPLDGYDAVRIRGVVAALASSPAESDRWFAEAVRQAPSLPLAHLDWARAKLTRGDAHGAIAEAAVAHAKGPRYADPLELWGEALMAKGEFAAAAGKFREADRWAPAWGRNHLRWGEALWRAGDLDDARTQFAAANGQGLSIPDRAALDVFLRRTAPAG